MSGADRKQQRPRAVLQSAYADGRGNGADFGHNDDKDPWKRVELLKRSPLTIDRILADGAYCTKTLFKTDQRRHCEMIIKVNLINRMQRFGLPKSLKCTP